MLKVLIIEDDTIISMRLEGLVEKLGYEVVSCVVTADEVFDIIQTKHVDLIISDIKIKGTLDGIDTIIKIHQFQQIPVIFLTAYSDKSTLNKIAMINFASYLVKPLHEKNLKAQIELAIIKYNLPRHKSIPITESIQYSYETKNLIYDTKLIYLSEKEYKFLELLLQSKNNIVPYEILESVVWDGGFVTDDMRRQLKHRIIKKCPDLPLEVIKGVGFKITLN